MKTQDEFVIFYNNQLRPLLVPLEEERKRVALLVGVVLSIIGFIAFGIVAFILILPFVEPGEKTEPVIWTIVLAVLIGGGAYALLTKGYVSTFKEVVIRNLVSFINPTLTYDPASHVPISVYKQSGLFKRGYDRYKGDDRVTGRLDKTDIEFSELHTEYKQVHYHKGRRRETWHTIFRGLFFVADFHKHFKGSTYVLPDLAESMLGVMGSMLQEHNSSHGDLAKMDDSEFEKHFVVYTSDQIEARYILSPALMRRITEFKERSGRKVHIGFVDSKMIIAITYRTGLFEPNIYKSLLDIDSINAFFDDLMLAIGIVEDMNLNTRIWTKV